MHVIFFLKLFIVISLKCTYHYFWTEKRKRTLNLSQIDTTFDFLFVLLFCVDWNYNAFFFCGLLFYSKHCVYAGILYLYTFNAALFVPCLRLNSLISFVLLEWLVFLFTFFSLCAKFTNISGSKQDYDVPSCLMRVCVSLCMCVQDCAFIFNSVIHSVIHYKIKMLPFRYIISFDKKTRKLQTKKNNNLKHK